MSGLGPACFVGGAGADDEGARLIEGREELPPDPGAGAVLAEKSWGDGVTLGHDGALEHLIGFVRGAFGELRLAAVGHRVVHGGLDLVEPTLIDAPVIAKLEQLIPLVPLHQPHNLAAIKAVMKRWPDLPQVVIGLAVTREGIPVRVWCWPGNTNDQTVLPEVKDGLRGWRAVD